MNRPQKRVIAAAMLVLVLSVLFPPWQSQNRTRLGWHFLFTMPDRGWSGSFWYDTQINFQWLAVEWALILMLATGLLLLLRPSNK